MNTDILVSDLRQSDSAGATSTHNFFARFLVRARDAIKRASVRAIDAAHGLLTGVRSALRGAWSNICDGARECRCGDARGLVQIFLQTPFDALLMVTGRTLSAVQTLVGVEPVARTLDADEIADLYKIYGNGINYSRVRLKEGRVALFSLAGRAFTHGDTIYVPPRLLGGDGRADRSLLVHEMAHVWQHQHEGTSYMSRALYAQKFGDGYDFAKALREGKSWQQMNPEQQAEIIQHAHARGFFEHPDDKPTSLVIEGTDYADLMRGVMHTLRGHHT